MPQLITRQEALERIRAEGGEPPCLMCAIHEARVGPLYSVAEDERFMVMLPRYVRTWGHVVVSPKRHVTRYSELAPEEWLENQRLALRAATMLERLWEPKRIYIASTGSSTVELTQSSRHLHVHVMPVFTTEDRPADLFSWQAGVYVAEPAEWEELRARYVEAWNAAP